MKRSSPPTFRTCRLADVVLIASKDTLRRNLGVSRPLVLVHYYRGDPQVRLAEREQKLAQAVEASKAYWIRQKPA